MNSTVSHPPGQSILRLTSDSLDDAANILKGLARSSYYGTFTCVVHNGKALLVRVEETLKPTDQTGGGKHGNRPR